MRLPVTGRHISITRSSLSARDGDTNSTEAASNPVLDRMHVSIHTTKISHQRTQSHAFNAPDWSVILIKGYGPLDTHHLRKQQRHVDRYALAELNRNPTRDATECVVSEQPDSSEQEVEENETIVFIPSSLTNRSIPQSPHAHLASLLPHSSPHSLSFHSIPY